MQALQPFHASQRYRNLPDELCHSYTLFKEIGSLLFISDTRKKILEYTVLKI